MCILSKYQTLEVNIFPDLVNSVDSMTITCLNVNKNMLVSKTAKMFF